MAKSPKAAAPAGGAISHVLLLADQAGFGAGSVLRFADPAPFPLDPEAVRPATQAEIDMASPSFLVDLVPPAAPSPANPASGQDGQSGQDNPETGI